MVNVFHDFQNNFNLVQSLKMLVFRCTEADMNLKGALQAQKISMNRQTSKLIIDQWFLTLPIFLKNIGHILILNTVIQYHQ